MYSCTQLFSNSGETENTCSLKQWEFKIAKLYYMTEGEMQGNMEFQITEYELAWSNCAC